MPNKVEIGITAKTDQAVTSMGKAAKAASSVEDALEKLIRKEKESAASKAAEAKFNAMTEAEKEAFLAARDLEKQTDKLNAATKNSEPSVSKFSLAFTELKSKLDLAKEGFDTFIGVFQKAMEAGKRGAEVRQTATSFEQLTEKVGASTDLLEQLRGSSRGTVDDMTLMRSTATLLAGTTGELATSLADATPELMEIAKAANKLNPTLGDTTFMYESIATGIKRASPMILDNLGLTINLTKANEDYAKKLGKSADKLTDEEKKIALLNATMEAGQTLIDQVGGSVDSDTDSFARLESATNNFTDAILTKLAPALTNAAEGATTLLTASEKLNAAMNEHAADVVRTSDTYENYVEEMQRAYSVAGQILLVDGRLFTVSNQLIGQNKLLTESEWEQTRATASTTEATNRAIAALHDREVTVLSNADATDGLTAAEIENNRISDLLSSSMSELTKEMLFNKAAADLDAGAALALAREMGLVDEKTYAAMSTLEKIREKYDLNRDGAIDATEATAGYVAEVEKLAGALGMLTDKTVNVNVNVNGQIPDFGLNEPDAPVIVTPDPDDGKVINGKRAAGGAVAPGETYLVGERGPELLQMGSQGGNVLPNNKLGGDTYNITIFSKENPGQIQQALSIAAMLGGASL